MQITGLLIDPRAQSVTQIRIGGGPTNVLHQLYALLGCGRVDAAPFGPFGDRRSALYFDDVGRSLSQPGFIAHNNLVVGRAALFGPIDDDGNDTDATWTVEATLDAVEWVVNVPAVG